MRKKQFREDEARDRAVEEKIVPLARGPDGGGDHGAAKLNLMFGWGEGISLDIVHGHVQSISGGTAQSPCGWIGKETCDLASGFPVAAKESRKRRGAGLAPFPSLPPPN